MRLGVQYGDLGQTTLTHASTSSTNADQNQGVNTRCHLSPLAWIHTNTVANPPAWQYDKYHHPNGKNEETKNKKREKNDKIPRSPWGERETRHGKNERKKTRWQIITSVTQFRRPTRDVCVLPFPLSSDISSWIFVTPPPPTKGWAIKWLGAGRLA